MIPHECKRVAEVDFPIAAVSKYAAREKSIRHGHPSTLHLWWARRPLASCRAMLLALLLPDPCDAHCPREFKTKAREILRPMPGRIGENDEDLRQALLRFIGDFASWDHSANSAFLESGRELVKAANPSETPLVVDPFAGGGSIPLEALRLGCDAYASDLNPVACLILKVLLEDVPRYGYTLAAELRHAGAEIKAAAEKKLAHFYPPDPDGAQPIAYLWARTVQCEAPNCGAEIPLVRSFWLSKKNGRLRALHYRVTHPKVGPPQVTFEIFVPQAKADVQRGTVSRAKATCICCGATLSPERVRAQLGARRGGADAVFDSSGKRIGGARLLAIVTVRHSETGRSYRVATEHDYKAVLAADTIIPTLPSLPDEHIALTELRRISIPLYGATKWIDVYSSRQKLTLATLAALIASRPAASTSDQVCRALALSFSRMANAHSAFSRWHESRETVEGIFARQAVGMVWDFCEGNPFSDATGSFSGGIEWVSAVIERCKLHHAGQVELADACQIPLPKQSASIWFTDPPYYDAVPYSHLADLFYVWLKRSIGERFPQLFRSKLTPKKEECVVDRPHSANPDAKTAAQYEAKMASAMHCGFDVTRPDGIGSIVFAHKSTEGWEALLSGILKSGWIITASWPITTEMSTRNTARETAALSASIHLVCRPRSDEKVGDWAEVLRELPVRVADWMARLEREGVRGADLVFACIGPALEIFSRYMRVEKPDGSEVRLGEFLEKVWEVVGRAALEQVLGTAEAQARNGQAGALEEDARLTALFLWTIKSTGTTDGDGKEKTEDNDEEETDEDSEELEGAKKSKGFSLAYDIVRRFAQPLGIHLDHWAGRIIHTEKGIVRLLPVTERARQLFGEEGSAGLAGRLERAPRSAAQLELFPAVVDTTPPKIKSRGKPVSVASSSAPVTPVQATTLDRVHAAMLLQATGRANALRALLVVEQERGPDFLRLANALSALYLQDCEEKRLLDAMLLAMPRR